MLATPAFLAWSMIDLAGVITLCLAGIMTLCLVTMAGRQAWRAAGRPAFPRCSRALGLVVELYLLTVCAYAFWGYCRQGIGDLTAAKHAAALRHLLFAATYLAACYGFLPPVTTLDGWRRRAMAWMRLHGMRG